MWKLLAPVVSAPITGFPACWRVVSVSSSKGAAVAVPNKGGEGGTEQIRFRPGSGSPSSEESPGPPQLIPGELGAGEVGDFSRA